MNWEVLSDEDDLVARLRTDRTNAIRKLYDKYSGALFTKILSIVKESNLADEVLKDVILEAWKTADDYKPEDGRLFTWLSKLAVDLAQQTLKTKGKEDSLQPSQIDPVNLIKSETGVHFQADNSGIKNLLNSLSRESSEILYTVFFLGMSEKETSKILDLPIDRVRGKVRLAILELRNLYNSNDMTDMQQ